MNLGQVRIDRDGHRSFFEVALHHGLIVLHAVPVSVVEDFRIVVAIRMSLIPFGKASASTNICMES